MHIIILFKFTNFIKTVNPRVYLFHFQTSNQSYKDDTDTETFVNCDPTPMLLEIWQLFQHHYSLPLNNVNL